MLKVNDNGIIIKGNTIKKKSAMLKRVDFNLFSLNIGIRSRSIALLNSEEFRAQIA